MDDVSFDRVVAGLAGAGLAVVVGAHLLGAEWAVPAEEGAGPFPSHDRAVAFWVVAGVAGLGAVACLFRAATVKRFPTALFTAAFLVAIVVVLAKPIYNSHQMELRVDGFAADTYTLPPKARVRLFNTSNAEMTVCLGTGGDCDATASGPAPLRSPGITVAPNHRRVVTMPEQLGSIRLTLVTSGATVARWDTVVRIMEPD